MYHKLTPVSDLNGDGFADALEIDSSTARIFTGSASGYDDSGVTLSINDSNGRVISFLDFDGDGLKDALLDIAMSDFRSPNDHRFHVIYGALK